MYIININITYTLRKKLYLTEIYALNTENITQTLHKNRSQQFPMY